MPRPDLGPGSSLARLRAAQRTAIMQRLSRLGRKRPDGEAGGEAVPVKPDHPLDLSGGAAAALEFDD